MSKPEILEIESSDGPFMVRLINWLDKQPEPNGETVVRLNVSKDDQIAVLHDELIEARRERDSHLQAFVRKSVCVERLTSEVSRLRRALEQIAKPSLGGKQQQYIAQAALEASNG